MPRLLTFFCLTTPLLLLLGCGPGGPKTYPVSGKVTIGGSPAANIQILFTPVPGGELQVAAGNTGDDGSYTLLTGNQGKSGAMAGKYTVVLSESEDVDSASGSGYMSGSGEGAEGTPETAGRIPADFTMEVEVTAGSNTIDIVVP